MCFDVKSYIFFINRITKLITYTYADIEKLTYFVNLFSIFLPFCFVFLRNYLKIIIIFWRKTLALMFSKVDIWSNFNEYLKLLVLHVCKSILAVRKSVHIRFGWILWRCRNFGSSFGSGWSDHMMWYTCFITFNAGIKPVFFTF